MAEVNYKQISDLVLSELHTSLGAIKEEEVEKLIELVWNFDFEGESRTVDVHVQRLRRKLGISHRLQTVYKTGYRLQV